MGLAEQAILDAKAITSDAINGFGISILFMAPDSTTATINGLATKHHLGMDLDGNLVNSKKASIAVSESLLVDAGYPVRNAKGEVYLKGHKVKWTDSSNALCEYVIREWFPDEAIGLIVCILGDFE